MELLGIGLSVERSVGRSVCKKKFNAFKILYYAYLQKQNIGGGKEGGWKEEDEEEE